MLSTQKIDTNAGEFVRAILKIDGEKVAQFSDLQRARRYADRFARAYTSDDGKLVRQDVKLVQVVTR